MSRDASIELDFAGEKRRFRLGIGQLVDLQEVCDSGPYVILDRLRTRERAVKIVDIEDEVDGKIVRRSARVSLEGELDPPKLPSLCKVQEISNVIRLGLIGGGLDATQARSLTTRFVDLKVPELNRVLAFSVLAVALFGAPEEEVGNAEAANPVESDLTTSPTES